MNIGNVNLSDVNNITDVYNSYVNQSSKTENDTFDSMLQSAMNMVNETNTLSNTAEEEEMKYAAGVSDNTHTLQIAQQKANVSLQYTVAVRNAAMDAYRMIMNLQF